MILNIAAYIGMLRYIISGVILYIITDKYSYFTNVIIYGTIRIMTVILVLVQLSKLTFAITLLVIIVNLLASVLIVYVAQKEREHFEYETILTFIFVTAIPQLLVGIATSKIYSLF